jgi:hypothetical protein
MGVGDKEEWCVVEEYVAHFISQQVTDVSLGTSTTDVPRDSSEYSVFRTQYFAPLRAVILSDSWRHDIAQLTYSIRVKLFANPYSTVE